MEFLPFFLILLSGIFFSVIFRRFHLPWVLALIAAGVVIGPYGLEIVTVNPTIDFISQVGLVFMMFMAGLETKLSSINEMRKSVSWLAFINALVPFLVGFGIGFAFGYPLLSSTLLGVIFMSSSIAVVIPTLESAGIIKTKLGRSIVAATVIEDIASLIFLSVLLQSLNPVTALPLPAFYILLVVILVAFRYGLPKLHQLVPKYRDEKDLFESEVRVVVALLIGVVATFEALGLHPIIAGFFTGLVLSDSISSEILTEKLRTLSYGLFIPMFFIVIGMETNVQALFSSAESIILVLVITCGSLLAKFTSGFAGARSLGYKVKEAATFGIATTPQLSTTLAVVFTAVELDLLGEELIAAMVTLSIVTTLVAPLALDGMYRKKSRS